MFQVPSGRMESLPQMEHRVATIIDLIARNQCDRRSILQLGYNLGRLSELTSLGREPFWDPWKGLVATWDRDVLDRLARDLRSATNDRLEPE
jgi:hypothetical protein